MTARPRSRQATPPAPPDADAAGPPEDPEQVARQILLRRLTERPRSRAELASSLARRQVPDDVAARVLDRFEQVGLIDDDAFAQMWVDSRRRGPGLARRALSYELRRKGVADDVARGAVDSIDDEAEQETARRLVERRLASVDRLDRVRAERRLIGMLARKGYGQGLAAGIVRTAMAGWHQGHQDADDTDGHHA